MNLLLVRPENVEPDGSFYASFEQSEHIACILRAKVGDKIKTGLLGGNIGEAELLEPSKKKARLRILQLNKIPPQKKNLEFVIALPRPQSFKKCLHFIASSGIPKVSFIQTERVEKSYWSSSAMSPENINRELFEGLEQGVDTIMPNINFYHSFREWLQAEKDNLPQMKLVAHPTATALPCPFAINEPVCVAIGPEGGFIKQEVEKFCEAGFQCVELGSFILRVEFALSFITGRLTP